MAENSKIEWTSHTFNPWRGCTKVSPGCANCYAETMSGRNPKTLGVWGPNGTRVVAAEAAWREPLKWDRAAAKAGERHRVFCASLADVFEDWQGPMVDSAENKLFDVGDGNWMAAEKVNRRAFPGFDPANDTFRVTMDDVRDRLFNLIDATPNLDWLLLTKRPENIERMLPAEPPIGFADKATGPLSGSLLLLNRKNIWLGTSVENQATADERIPHLLRVPAAVRFLSCEPLLGPVSLQPYRDADGNVRAAQGINCDWVIVGGESGHGARPMQIEWARSLVEQCRAAGVACFVKQLGARPIEVREFGIAPGSLTLDTYDMPGGEPDDEVIPLKLIDRKGGDMDEWPDDLRVREFPQPIQ